MVGSDAAMDLTPLRLLEQSRIAEAVADIHRQLAAQPPWSEAEQLLGLLANIHLRACDVPAAAPALIALINHGGPATGQHLLTLARAQVEMGDAAEAMAPLNLLLGAALPDGMRADIIVLHARALNRLGRQDEARAALADALALVPAHAEASLWTGLLAPARTGSPRVLSALAAPAEAEAARRDTAWDWPADWIPSDFVARLAPFINQGQFRDLRFVVVDRVGAPLLRADAFANPAGIGAAVAGPVRLVPAAGRADWAEALRPALDHLAALQAAFGGTLLVSDLPAARPGLLSPVGAACLKRGGTAEVQVFMDIDLTQPESALWRAIRSRVRSHVNRADKRLRLAVLDRDHAEWSLLEAFRQLHYVHFPEARADGMFFAMPQIRHLIAEGRLSLLVGYDGDRPVAATIVADEGDTAHYYAGRYVHDVGNNFGAWSMWRAIQGAKARGLRRFHLGYWDFEECRSDKMRSIAHYKAGFTDTLRYEQNWRLDAAQAGLANDQ